MATSPISMNGGTYTITGPEGLFFLVADSNGDYVYAVGQHVNENGSPLIISFDPPIAPTVNVGTLYQAILAQGILAQAILP